MKKYYYIYEIMSDWNKEFRFKAFSQHSAIQWIEEHLSKSKHKNSKFKIQEIYRN